MRLLCLVSGEGDIKITWSRDDVAMVFSDRIKSTVVGELLIEDILPEDAGVYRCSATRNNESVHVETEVVVSGKIICYLSERVGHHAPVVGFLVLFIK